MSCNSISLKLSQDHGFTHEFEDLVRNPTEAIAHTQLEKAQASLQEDGLEMEQSIVQLSSGDRSRRATVETAQGSAKAQGRGSSRAKVSKNDANPLIAASKARTKTTKEFCEAERLLKKAIVYGEHILGSVAPTVLDEVKDDPTLELLRNRLEMVQVALDPRGGKDAMDPSEHLFHLACQDPYLKDCQTTILADREACQSLGMVKYCRQFLFDMCL